MYIYEYIEYAMRGKSNSTKIKSNEIKPKEKLKRKNGKQKQRYCDITPFTRQFRIINESEHKRNQNQWIIELRLLIVSLIVSLFLLLFTFFA